MSQIIICRHGNTFDTGDIVTRVGARTDLPLSRSGRLQAEKLGQELASYNFAKAYCSPLIRTQQTALAIISPETPLVTLEFLTEIDYGVDENKPETEVIARLGQDMIDLWDLDAVVPNGWTVKPEALIAAWELFFEHHRDADKNILVVTSNGIARFVLDVITNPDFKAPRKLRTAAYGAIDLGGGKTELKFWDRRSQR